MTVGAETWDGMAPVDARVGRPGPKQSCLRMLIRDLVISVLAIVGVFGGLVALVLSADSGCSVECDTEENRKAAERILDNGGDLEQETLCSGDTPLMWAAHAGDADLTRRLLAAGAVVEHRDRDGNAPLYWAAREGHPDVARILLDAGADPDSRNYEGHTTLTFAAEAGDAEMVRLLLEAGADPDPPTSPNDRPSGGGYESEDPEHRGTASTNSPLVRAAFFRDAEVVGLLLDAGADPNRSVALGSNEMFLLALVSPMSLSGDPVIEALGLAPFVPVSVDAVPDDSTPDVSAPTTTIVGDGGPLVVTPLLAAIAGGVAELGSGIEDVPPPTMEDGKDFDGEDFAEAFDFPPARGDSSDTAEIVRRMVEAGADPDGAGSLGLTPLYLAAAAGDTELVQVLLDVGADPLVRVQGLSPRDAAELGGFRETAALLDAAMAGPTFLPATVVTGSPPTTRPQRAP